MAATVGSKAVRLGSSERTRGSDIGGEGVPHAIPIASSRGTSPANTGNRFGISSLAGTIRSNTGAGCSVGMTAYLGVGRFGAFQPHLSAGVTSANRSQAIYCDGWRQSYTPGNSAEQKSLNQRDKLLGLLHFGTVPAIFNYRETGPGDGLVIKLPGTQGNYGVLPAPHDQGWQPRQPK